MNLPVIVVNFITGIIITLGCLTVVLLLMMAIYFIGKQIIEFIFKLSSSRLVIAEFRKYYLRGIASGDIEITPVMKWILKKYEN